MSTTRKLRRPKGRTVLGMPLRTAAIAGACSLLIVVSLAIPSYMGPPPEDQADAAEARHNPVLATVLATAKASEAPLSTAPAPRAKPLSPVPVQAPASGALETSADGDLSVAVRFKWKEFETGERVLAFVRLENHSLRAVHVPALHEPNPGLALVVIDAAGEEVRRIVEEGKERLPRATVRLDPGCSVEWPVTVVAEGEAPLAPAEYAAYAEFRPDPALDRLGLPVWAAAKGPLRSYRIPLVVTPKAK